MLRYVGPLVCAALLAIAYFVPADGAEQPWLTVGLFCLLALTPLWWVVAAATARTAWPHFALVWLPAVGGVWACIYATGVNDLALGYVLGPAAAMVLLSVIGAVALGLRVWGPGRRA